MRSLLLTSSSPQQMVMRMSAPPKQSPRSIRVIVQQRPKPGFIHTRTPLAPALIGMRMVTGRRRIARSLRLRTRPWFRKLLLRLRGRFMTSLRYLQPA